jgi:hypothetical protein
MSIQQRVITAVLGDRKYFLFKNVDKPYSIYVIYKPNKNLKR